MKIIKHLLPLILTILIAIILNIRIAGIPPLGKVLDPFNGFWVNAETDKFTWSETLYLEGLQDSVTIKYDDRRVPHVFAQNDHDLYFMQGYVTARDRLWQMELQTHFAAGRISEIMGKSTKEMDRMIRRMGLSESARKSMELVRQDQELLALIQAYSDGVNAHIASLKYATYPVEYKLLDYAPEQWNPEKCILLNSYMSYLLTSYEEDFKMTNAYVLFGENFLSEWFPEFPEGIIPVIPEDHAWEFEAGTVDTPMVKVSRTFIQKMENYVADERNGSNNWAVSGRKTASGKPILANDPHLSLNLPSIWYELQLCGPKSNTYGVSLPGAPFIIIGFNKHISWGLTNAQRDVKDWYSIKFKDEKKESYLFDTTYMPVNYRVEKIKVRGGSTCYDTIRETHLGPVVFDNSFHSDTLLLGLALSWMLHEKGNPARTFYQLNNARDYSGYKAALQNHTIPAQNFAFASRNGNIAMWQQGNFPMKWPGQGKLVLDGTNPTHEWQDTIEFEQNPHAFNPVQGYLLSANQHPTDTSYPYYYNGNFEFFRNRRIDQQLSEMPVIRPDDMMKLQTDNYHLQAQESLPFMLGYLNSQKLTATEMAYYTQLKNWNFMSDADEVAPAIYEVWYDTLYHLTFDEMNGYKFPLPKPKAYVFNRVLRDSIDHPIFDVQRTEENENVRDLCRRSFTAAVKKLEAWKNEHEDEKELNWANYKNTRLTHIARVLQPFNIENIQIGGNKGIVNATGSTHGPSWRMVVEMSTPIIAYGVYPGGQSGNPGSPYYKQFVEKWAKGDYYRLVFMEEVNDKKDQVIFTQKIKGI